MSSTDAISVVIPAYQAEPYLSGALASVATQTCLPDEVLVVNDGSTDRTAEIARSWSDQLPVVLIDKPVNEGLGMARKSAIAQASNELIAQLDADDIWLPDHLELLHRTYEGTGCIASARTITWFPGEGIHIGASAEIPPRTKQRLAIFERNWLTAAALFDRTTYQRCGGYSDLRQIEDWDLWMRMLESGAWVVRAPYPTVLYRQRPGSLSAGAPIEPLITVLELHKAGADSQTRAVIDRTLRRYRARTLLDDAIQAWEDGHTKRARYLFAHAALTDRSLRLGMSPAGGSVTLRAAYGLLAPKSAMRSRQRRKNKFALG
jgi:glycosyltransferase involved in cell wall biosynthesis